MSSDATFRPGVAKGAAEHPAEASPTKQAARLTPPGGAHASKPGQLERRPGGRTELLNCGREDFVGGCRDGDELPLSLLTSRGLSRVVESFVEAGRVEADRVEAGRVEAGRVCDQTPVEGWAVERRADRHRPHPARSIQTLRSVASNFSPYASVR